MEKRRNCSSGAISPLFHYTFNISLTSGVKLHIHLLNVVVRFIFSSLPQHWYVEVRISRSVSESPLEFEITKVDCICIFMFLVPCITAVLSISYKIACAPPKTQTGVFAVRLEMRWIFEYSQSTLRGLWSDCSDAQAGMSLRCVHIQFCRKYCAPLKKHWWSYFSDSFPGKPIKFALEPSTGNLYFIGYRIQLTKPVIIIGVISPNGGATIVYNSGDQYYDHYYEKRVVICLHPEKGYRHKNCHVKKMIFSRMKTAKPQIASSSALFDRALISANMQCFCKRTARPWTDCVDVQAEFLHRLCALHPKAQFTWRFFFMAFYFFLFFIYFFFFNFYLFIYLFFFFLALFILDLYVFDCFWKAMLYDMAFPR